MPEIKTRADSLREYLTGASSDGGAQTNPNLSLGDYRSSTEVASFSLLINNAISGIQIVFASGGNRLGTGILKAVDEDTIQWRCEGEAYGPPVSILNGETKIVETANLPGAYLRVKRLSANELEGEASVILSAKMNSVFAMDDVSSAQALAGETNYRASILQNESPSTVLNFKRWISELGTSQLSNILQLPASGGGIISTTGSFADWPEQGWCHIKNGAATKEIVYYSERSADTLTVLESCRGRLGTTAAIGSTTDTIHAVPGIAIGLEMTDSSGALQKINTESIAPTGIIWKTGITPTDGILMPIFEAYEMIGIWYKREIPENAASNALSRVVLETNFESA